MRLLAIEMATPVGGVALMKEDHLIAEYRLDMPMAHAERIMVLVDRVLQDGRTAVSDLDAIAVSVGPGSFTGLRVAVGTAKGLATGRTIALAAVPTLEALAGNVSIPGTIICPMIDAGKTEVYAALFQAGAGGLKRRMEDQVVSPSRLAEWIRDGFKSPVIFVGAAAESHREVLGPILKDRAVWVDPSLSHPRPSVVGRLGLDRLRRGESADPRRLEPLYLRRSDAEINWERGIRPKPLKRFGAGGGRKIR